MHLKHALLTLMVVALPQAGWGQADPQTVAKIVDEGKNHNQVMKHLTHLTQKIGHRLTASPQLENAYRWTTQQFKEFGCSNVHLEEWGEYPVGFDRRRRQVGRMVSPIKLDFEFTSPSWTPGTKGRVRGEAVLEPTTAAEFEKVKDRLKGAWVITKRTTRTPPPDEVAKLLEASGKAGTVFGSRSDLVVTGGNHRIKWEELPKDVRVVIRKQDMEVVNTKLEANEKVELEFDMDNKFIKGPRKNYNVVAEIPGTEKPDEVVIISGHLDSWDGPGSEGAQDNGTGTCVTLEAARILGKVKAKPKRTIRFILWTGEEQGLFGSFDYVKKHKEELDKISAVFVDDGGTNYEGGVACIEAEEPILREAFEPAIKAFPEMPMKLDRVKRLQRFGGSDHYPFLQVDVPAFFWYETGKSDYNHVHHTQYDRIGTAVPEYLVQSSTNSAAVAYIVASAPTLLPREEKPKPEEKPKN